jgi:hypothetical protein
VVNATAHPADKISRPPTSVRLAGLTAFVFAILQSICSAVVALSAVRVAIGLSALAVVSGTYAPARGFHQDSIRIPMLILAGLGALVNLAVLIRVWRLRARTSARWRRRAISAKERRSEGVQFILAVVTLLAITAEVITHSMIHLKAPESTRHISQSVSGATASKLQPSMTFDA